MYHATWESNPAAVPALPGAQVWLDAIAAERPERERHLAVHAGHVTHLGRVDRLALATFGGEIPWLGLVGEAGSIRVRAKDAVVAGATELLFVATGGDPVREAEAFFGATESIRG